MHPHRTLLPILVASLALVACGGEPLDEGERSTDTKSYRITQAPADEDWDFVDLVKDFQSDIPSWVDLDSTSRAAKLGGVAWTWEQELVPKVGGNITPMAVELTQQLVEVPYATFIKKLPAARWGVKLAYRVGGEVVVDEYDAQKRPTRQVERMVLSPFPCRIDVGPANSDMTKTEIIEYGPGQAKVYWRVYLSDNRSTEADVGSVLFQAYDAKSTLVVFHSAHRLNAVGVHIPNMIVQEVLQTYFLDHIKQYKKVVGAK